MIAKPDSHHHHNHDASQFTRTRNLSRGEPAFACRAVPAHPVQVALFARGVRLRNGRSARPDVLEVAPREPPRAALRATKYRRPTVPRLSCPPNAHYAVRQQAPWKKVVWLIASAPPRSTTPRRCGTRSEVRWLTPITRAAARVIGAPPPAGTFWSSSATTGRPRRGGWRVSSSATCASTTTCRSAMSVRLAPSHRQASCDICSTRPSTRFAPRARRSRSVVMPATGWRSFRRSPASISRARSTGARTTGRSGDGIGSTRRKPSARPRDPRRRNRSDCGRDRLRRLGLVPTHCPVARRTDLVRHNAAHGPLGPGRPGPVAPARPRRPRPGAAQPLAAIRRAQVAHPGAQPIPPDAHPELIRHLAMTIPARHNEVASN